MNRKKEMEWKPEKSKVFLFYVSVLMYMMSRKGKCVNAGEKEGSPLVSAKTWRMSAGMGYRTVWMGWP